MTAAAMSRRVRSGFDVAVCRTFPASPRRVAENLNSDGRRRFARTPRYHDFSIVMNADRRLAGFTAVNIDGKRIRAVNRDDKTVIENPTLKDLGVEFARVGGGGGERRLQAGPPHPSRRARRTSHFTTSSSSRAFRIQIRLNARHGCSRKAISSCAEIRRGEPSSRRWPRKETRSSVTNAAPQVGFFNQGSDLDRPGSKGKLRWRAWSRPTSCDNAVTMKSRVSVCRRAGVRR